MIPEYWIIIYLCFSAAAMFVIMIVNYRIWKLVFNLPVTPMGRVTWGMVKVVPC